MEKKDVLSVNNIAEIKFDHLYKKVAWKVLSLLLLGYIISYLDRVNRVVWQT